MIYYIEYVIFQVFKWIILLLPLKSAQRLGYYLGTLGFYIAKRRRLIALENLFQAFPDKSDRERKLIARGAFQNYGITLSELLWFPNLTESMIKKLVNVCNLNLMIEKYREGKGLVMLSGHCGNWELLALAFGYLSKIPISIIVQTQNNHLVDEVINKHRSLFGNKVIPWGMAIREIIRTLESRGVVAVAPDQSGAKDSIYVKFFGRVTATHQGPAVFALRVGTPLLIVLMNRLADGTYQARIQEVPVNDLNGYSEENVVKLTQRHVDILEDHIRQYPDHWLWMHRRWKHVRENSNYID